MYSGRECCNDAAIQVKAYYMSVLFVLKSRSCIHVNSEIVCANLILISSTLDNCQIHLQRVSASWLYNK